METSSDLTQAAETPVLPLSVNYAAIAELFVYPVDDSYKEKVNTVFEYLTTKVPEAAQEMQSFFDCVNLLSTQEIQELFLRSFDLQAITSLDIGFVLFGEDYKRGQLLVHLNQEHVNAGNVCNTELPDHLPNVLRLLSVMTDVAIREEIASILLMPAVDRMIKEFATEKIEKKDVLYKKHHQGLLEYSKGYRMAYRDLLSTLFIALKTDFIYEPEDLEMIKNHGHGFLREQPGITVSEEKDYAQNIKTEIQTE